MVLLLTRTLTVFFAMVPTVLACSLSLAAGAVNDTSDRVKPAFWLFYSGIFVLVVHVGLFIYRALKKKRKSQWVFWSTIVLSIFTIPIVFFLILMSAGMSCGFGASNPPIFLLIFELICLTAQLIPWRFYSKPTQSPIPLN